MPELINSLDAGARTLSVSLPQRSENGIVEVKLRRGKAVPPYILYTRARGA